VQPLSVGLIAGQDQTSALVEALGASDRLQLVGFAQLGANRTGADQQLDKLADSGAKVEVFDDPRELAMRCRPRLLILWGQDVQKQYLDMVIELGSWVCIKPPVADNLEQAKGTYELARNCKAGIFTYMPWLFLETYRAVEDWLKYNSDDPVRTVFARWVGPFMEQDPEQQTYRFAGADFAYEALHVVHRWLGLPLELHCLALSNEGRLGMGGPGAGCAVSLRHPSGQASVQCLWARRDVDRSMIVQTEKGLLISIAPQEASLYDPGGKLLDSSEMPSFEAGLREARIRCLEAMWQAIIEHQVYTAFDIKQNLQTLAILQAAGVSARTDQLERLDRVANVEGLLAGD